jgi:hypothetical protein
VNNHRECPHCGSTLFIAPALGDGTIYVICAQCDELLGMRLEPDYYRCLSFQFPTIDDEAIAHITGARTFPPLLTRNASL